MLRADEKCRSWSGYYRRGAGIICSSGSVSRIRRTRYPCVIHVDIPGCKPHTAGRFDQIPMFQQEWRSAGLNVLFSCSEHLYSRKMV